MDVELQEVPLHRTQAETSAAGQPSKPRKRVSFEDNTYYVIENDESDGEDDLQDQSPVEEGWMYAWLKQFASAFNPTIDYTQVKKNRSTPQAGDAVVNLRKEMRTNSGDQQQQGTTVLSKAHLHGNRTSYLLNPSTT